MKRLAYFLSGFIGIFAQLLGNSVMAGGLYLNEFSTPTMGTAGAGAQAWANDASTSFHNPAGMTRLDGNQLMLGGGFLAVDLEFEPAPNTPIEGNDGGNAGGPGPILGAYGTYSVSDDLKLGMNIISISAAILDYDDGWRVRGKANPLHVLVVAVQVGRRHEGLPPQGWPCCPTSGWRGCGRARPPPPCQPLPPAPAPDAQH